MRKNIFWLIYILSLTFCVMVFLPILEYSQFDQKFLTSYDEIEKANAENIFGSLVRADLGKSEFKTSTGSEKKDCVTFKLFGLIPIKTVEVELLDDTQYFLGGNIIGICLDCEGALVLSVNDNSACRDTLLKGDIIVEVNGEHFSNFDDFQAKLDSCDEEVLIKYIRKNKEYEAIVKLNDAKKLGVLAKNDISGIGTLTYVNTSTHNFGALGHAITEENEGNLVPCKSGNIYTCNLLGIKKGEKNEAGCLKCVFMQGEKSEGKIYSNEKFGISGKLDENNLIDENQTAKLGGRFSVRPGKAFIYSAVSGINEKYEIEIIKTNAQKNADDKSLVFRVTDKRLLELTGGIVQGMSGSPIVQNDKIVGAVTHVFLADATKGFGVYIDWML